jgi:hypothetical protein
MKTVQINNKHYQECNVVILSTDKTSKLGLHSDKKLNLHDSELTKNLPHYQPQHLYILSNDEIKEGNWVIALDTNIVFKCNAYEAEKPIKQFKNLYKKIIATTDSSLEIPDRNGAPQYDPYGLPQIPKSFIEYFISEYNKDNVISKVLVEVEHSSKNSTVNLLCNDGNFQIKLNQNNEIFILTEQKQETLENFALELGYVWENTESSARRVLEKFFEYQKQSYSREEVVKLLINHTINLRNKENDLEFTNNFIQQNLK